MVAKGQEVVREKKFFKVREMSKKFYYGSGKTGNFEEKSGKIKIVRSLI